MTVIDDYLSSLNGTEKAVIGHMYDLVRQWIPEATEDLSYGMPAFKYKGKGLVSIMANKNFLSLYPFGAVEKLAVDTSAFEKTSGSIHFSSKKPIPDKLLKEIILARKQQIELKT